MQTLQSAQAPAEPFNVPQTTLTATINGMTYTVTYSSTANQGTTTFNGQTANSSTVSVTITQQDGTTLANETSTEYYTTSPFTLLGTSGTTAGTSYTLMVNSVNPLPSMLTVGATGTLFSGNYTASGSTTVSGMLTETYSVTAGTTANTLTLTIESDGTLNGQTVSDSTVFSVDAMGNIQLQSVKVMVNGQSYTFNASM